MMDQCQIATRQPLLTTSLVPHLIRSSTPNSPGIIGWPKDAATDGGPTSNVKTAVKLGEQFFKLWSPLIIPMCLSYPGFQSQLLIGLVTMLLRTDLALCGHTCGIMSEGDNDDFSPCLAALAYMPLEYDEEDEDMDQDGDGEEDETMGEGSISTTAIDYDGIDYDDHYDPRGAHIQPQSTIETIFPMADVKTLFKSTKKGPKSSSTSTPSAKLSSQQEWVVVNIVTWISILSVPFIPQQLGVSVEHFKIETPSFITTNPPNKTTKPVVKSLRDLQAMAKQKSASTPSRAGNQPQPLPNFSPKPSQNKLKTPTGIATSNRFPTSLQYHLEDQLSLYSLPWKLIAQLVKTHTSFIPIPHSLVLDRLLIALPFLRPMDSHNNNGDPNPHDCETWSTVHPPSFPTRLASTSTPTGQVYGY